MSTPKPRRNPGSPKTVLSNTQHHKQCKPCKQKPTHLEEHGDSHETQGKLTIKQQKEAATGCQWTVDGHLPIQKMTKQPNRSHQEAKVVQQDIARTVIKTETVKNIRKSNNATRRTQSTNGFRCRIAVDSDDSDEHANQPSARQKSQQSIKAAAAQIIRPKCNLYLRPHTQSTPMSSLSERCTNNATEIKTALTRCLKMNGKHDYRGKGRRRHVVDPSPVVLLHKKSSIDPGTKDTPKHSQPMPTSRNTNKKRRKAVRQNSPFLKKLPGEIRNQIYEHVMPDVRIMIFASSPKAEVAEAKKLWQNQDKHIKQPRSRLYCALDREQWNSGVTLSTSMLLVSRQISREALHFLYSRTTFCFAGLNVACRFLNEAESSGVSSIKSIELDSGTYGEPYLTTNSIFKVKYERKWEGVCKLVGTRATSLAYLKLYSHSVDLQLQKIEQTGWHQALMRIVEHRKLEDVEIHLTNPWVGPAKLARLRKEMEERMMTTRGQDMREHKEHQHYLRLIREAEGTEQEKQAKLPPTQAVKCLRITLNCPQQQ